MSADLDSWNQAAEAWDREVAREGSYRTHLITNALRQLLPDLKDKRVLDAGCGNGYYTQWLTKEGAQVEGIDGAEEMITIAKNNYPQIDFTTADLTKPINKASGSYDLVLANMLLMHMGDISVFLPEARRLLKPNGHLVFSVLHPCFNEPTARLYKSLLDKLTQAKPSALIYDYFSGTRGRYESHMSAKLTHYHRTLEEYSSELKNAGLVIENMCEPHKLPEEFLKSNPKMEYAQRLPRFIFFNCKLA